ncbi:acyl carrier protein [Burkholderia phage BCSR5]|nr:acyl carrier protein [Burkholderia phage BCSR5]
MSAIGAELHDFLVAVEGVQEKHDLSTEEVIQLCCQHAAALAEGIVQRRKQERKKPAKVKEEPMKAEPAFIHSMKVVPADTPYISARNQERVFLIVSEQLGIARAELKASQSLVNDLGADSLDTVELVMAMEDEFQVEVQDEDAEACITIQDIFNLVARKVKQ